MSLISNFPANQIGIVDLLQGYLRRANDGELASALVVVV